MKPRVMVVGGEESVREPLKSRLELDRVEVVAAGGADEAQRLFSRQGAEIGILVADLGTPGKDGLQLMDWARGQSPRPRVILIAGNGEKEAVVRAFRQGASDCLEKPVDMDGLFQAVSRGLREFQREREGQDRVARLEARVERVEGKAEDKFWYVSKARSMEKVNEWITLLRREAMRGGVEEPIVLILGESGTGKEGIARMIHAGSRRGKSAWVAVNCAAFSEPLLESELFGHEKGAFAGAASMKRGLFEIARGGTLFLDEIGEMGVRVQAQCLRALQERVFRRVGGEADQEADVRVIAATGRNLLERVREGRFSEDLHRRLSQAVIEVPALRERGEDLVPMARQFAERAFQARGKTFEGFTPEAEASLRDYGWPGGVSELLNVVERAALAWQGAGSLGARALSLSAGNGAFTAGSKAVAAAIGSGPRLVAAHGVVDLSDGQTYTDLKKRWSDTFEREYLTSLLQRHGGNVSAAARESRLDRSNFLRLLRKHAVRATEFRKAA